MRYSLVIALSSLVFAVLHPGAAAAEEACLKCHVAISKLKVKHPALDMGCNSCHNTPHAKKKAELSLSAEVPDLCFNCHDKSMTEKKFVHTAVAAGMCLSCHNPHATDNPGMTVAAVPNLCFQCHETDAMVKKNVHVAAAQGKCLTCHNPHSSENSYVLTSLVEEHCEACHDDQRSGRHVMVRVSPGDNHPISGKPDPLRPGKMISCSSCHNPHASEQRISTKNLKDPSTICRRCHSKINAGS
jgi:predicted CXXCH cytochrome family protein